MAKKIIRQCRVCGTDFKSPVIKIKKFCSMQCYRVSQRRGDYVTGIRKSPPFRECFRCGILVARNYSTRRNGEKSTKAFCSRDCYDKHRVEARGNCRRCGLPIPPAGGKYCSEECWKAEKKAKPKHCVNCGTYFTPVKFHTGHGRMISYNSGKTCSAECGLAWISNNGERNRKISSAFAGNKHPNWQGGSHVDGFRGHEWDELREKARDRAGRCCEHCGMSEIDHLKKFHQRLSVNHKEPFHQHKRKARANKLSNLEALCKSCHTKADWKWRKEHPVQHTLKLFLR